MESIVSLDQCIKVSQFGSLDPAASPSKIMDESSKIALAAHGYEILEQIGHGGYSKIFKVKSHKYGGLYAAKIVNRVSEHKKGSSEGIDREILALRTLHHPNIINMYDFFEAGTNEILILDYCPGGSLHDIIKSGFYGVKPRMVRYLKQVLDALVYMHKKGFSHSDIKPANVLIDANGRCKLADFGMSLDFNDGVLSTKHQGSLQYAAPEIYKKSAFNPIKADVWALGILFYQAIIGKLPWPKEKELIGTAVVNGGLVVSDDFPKPFGSLIRSMTSMNPDSRPSLERIQSLKLWNQLIPNFTQTKYYQTRRMVHRTSSLFMIGKPRKHCLLASNGQV